MPTGLVAIVRSLHYQRGSREASTITMLPSHLTLTCNQLQQYIAEMVSQQCEQHNNGSAIVALS